MNMCTYKLYNTIQNQSINC